MKKIPYILLMTTLVLVPFTISAWATEDFTLIVYKIQDIEAGNPVVVKGITVDQDSMAISDIGITVVFPSEQINTITDSRGQFSASSSNSTETGTYTATIFARYNDRVASTNITYSVVSAQSKSGVGFESIQDISNKTLKQTDLDPFSKMIKTMEEQKAIQTKKEKITKQNQTIYKQRQQIHEQLQQDLKSLEKEHEAHTPRNAFLSFLSNINSAVRNIFWQQFLFTEDLTTQAQTAKHNALEDGKTSLEATKIFQEKASITRKKIVEFTTKSNIEYGNATLTEQEKFNVDGKIPRE